MHIYGFMCLCIPTLLLNARFSFLYVIDAKYRFDISFPNSFRNTERPKIIDTKILYILCFTLWWWWWWWWCVCVCGRGGGGGSPGGGGGGGKARQDYFTHFEPSQSLDAAKMGDPQNKPPGHPQAELGLFHLWPELGFNPQRWDDKRFRVLKMISGLNHSATEAAEFCFTCIITCVGRLSFISKTVPNFNITWVWPHHVHAFISLFLSFFIIIFWRPFLIFLVMFMTVWSINLQIMNMWLWRNVATLRFWRLHSSRATYLVSVYCIKSLSRENKTRYLLNSFSFYLFKHYRMN